MKKLLYLGAAALITSLGMASCDDNTDFSKVHVLSDDEIAEMARQDSIKQAQMAMINADFIHDYTVEFYISENSYEGAFLEIDTRKMAQDFGISETELVHGIANLRSEYLENGAYADGAKLQGFAIEGSTHQDNMTAYNTNGIWGHWWDENGDVTSWGDNARVYLEYYEPENEGDPYGFYVGQMPGMLQANQEITVLECLKYQDTRMALQIKVIGRERGEIKAGIVYDEDVNVELTPNDAGSYDPHAFSFDLPAVLAATGLSEISNSNLIAYKADGSFAQELNADAGFWFDKTGPVGGWGDDASCWISYGITDDPATIGVCLMPGATAAGDHYDHDFGFYNGDKIAMLHVHIDVSAFSDEEQRPEGDPCTVETDITMEKTFDQSYTSIQYDVRDILKDAFKLTTYEIFQAKNDGSLKIWIDNEGEGDPAYSADTPGYWLSADGQNVGWGDGIFWLSLGGSEQELYIYGGNHPDNCDPNGQDCHVRYVITCNGGVAILNVNFNVVGFVDPETAPGTTPADATVDYTYEKDYTDDYASVDEDVQDLVRNTFNLTTYGVQKAIQTGEMKCYINSLDGDGIGTGSGPSEYWLDADCNPTDWGNGIIYFGLYADAQGDYIMLGGGNHPGNCDPAQTYDLNFTMYVVYQGTTLTINVSYKVNAI